METYGKILCETSTGLESRPPLNREFLEKILNVTATATRSTIDSRSAITTTINDRSNELQEMNSTLEKYKRLAETDSLTQLYNRRAFDRTLTGIYDDARGELFGALILVDIDRFKSINDRFGHAAGDEVLRCFGSIMRENIREGDIAARTGGEEFVLVLHHASPKVATAVADRIRMLCALSAMQTPSGRLSATVSAGIAFAANDSASFDEVLHRADASLYRAKDDGRDRVVLDEDYQAVA